MLKNPVIVGCRYVSKGVIIVSTYPQRVAGNILPLSIAGTLPEAFSEWFFTEYTIDHESADEDCELCNHE